MFMGTLIHVIADSETLIYLIKPYGIFFIQCVHKLTEYLGFAVFTSLPVNIVQDSEYLQECEDQVEAIVPEDKVDDLSAIENEEVADDEESGLSDNECVPRDLEDSGINYKRVVLKSEKNPEEFQSELKEAVTKDESDYYEDLILHIKERKASRKRQHVRKRGPRDLERFNIVVRGVAREKRKTFPEFKPMLEQEEKLDDLTMESSSNEEEQRDSEIEESSSNSDNQHESSFEFEDESSSEEIKINPKFENSRKRHRRDYGQTVEFLREQLVKHG
ncbi:hypothetical protein FO519_004068 [Halicephalobus sp. NKZ332]|nr:hypothetical protein FO519_004068 [Halicephalobus sp. NKZ332]